MLLTELSGLLKIRRSNVIYIVQFKYYVVCIRDGLPGSFLEKRALNMQVSICSYFCNYSVTFITSNLGRY